MRILEPHTRRPRLYVVRRLVLFAAILTLALAVPAGAQTGVSMTAEAGVGGLVEANAPVPMTIEVSADLLFVGTIEITQGGSTMALAAEVPAGTTKVFEVTAPPVSSGNYTIGLVLDGGTEPLEKVQLRLDTPADDAVAVGVVDDPAVVADLNRVRTAIGDKSVKPVEISGETRPGPLAYVVAADPAKVNEVEDWVEAGGRLVVPPGAETALALGLEPLGTVPGTEVAWYRAGKGEVMVGDRIDIDDWSRIIRPVPTPFVYSPEFGQSPPDTMLAQAATGSGSGGSAELPWLAAFMVGYAVIAGPVVFLVLKRLGRRELAWFAVPVVATLALVGFWVAGRQRLDSTTLAHATVQLVSDEGSVARTSVVLAAGSAGVFELGASDVEAIYPVPVLDQFGSQGSFSPTGTVAGESISFELSQLGFAGAGVIHSVEPSLAAVADGDSVNVSNLTDRPALAWGVVNSSAVVAGGGRLEAGGSASGEIGSAGFFGSNISDWVMQSINRFDDQGWQVFYPMGEAVRALAGSAYAFAFFEDDPIDLTIDGRPVTVLGTTVAVVAFDGELRAGGSAAGRLVAYADDAYLEPGYPGEVVWGSAATARVVVPAGAAGLSLAYNDQFGVGSRPQTFEAWDWAAGSFDVVELGELDPEYVAGNGEVVVRASHGEQAAELGGNAISLGAIQVRWSTS